MSFSFNSKIVIDITTTAHGSREEVEKQHRESILQSLESWMAFYSAPAAAAAGGAGAPTQHLTPEEEWRLSTQHLTPEEEWRLSTSISNAAANVSKRIEDTAADIVGVGHKFPTLYHRGERLAFDKVCLTPEHHLLFKGVRNGTFWSLTNPDSIAIIIGMLERMGFAYNIAAKAGWVETIRPD
jgi:hypothetical protein